jgi:uncharacterized RDD family membrane protein YckC
MPSSPATQPSWKQEVNRRLAEHKNRKGISVLENDLPEEGHGSPTSRAAAAAARVAERYAKAPSYSEMQASEARAALRAAEAATRAALQAQAAAQAALDNLGAAGEECDAESGMQQAGSPPAQQDGLWQNRETREPSRTAHQQFEVRWEPDMPAYRPVSEQLEPAGPNRRTFAVGQLEFDGESQTIEPVQAAQPIPANLIEFPRELVATRRMRPRLTESYAGAGPETNSQLSIFEVDPSTISTDPALPGTDTQMPSWSDYEWRAIELEERQVAEPENRHEPVRIALHQAPLKRRFLATIVDVALILSTVCALAAFLASRLHHFPGIRASELTALAALLIVGVLYEGLFLLYAKCTPGMRYAQLALCTFDGEYPTREQMKSRLVSMLLSLLPMGLGMLWAIFDEDNMSWHDRHSRTYLRQC